MEYHHLIMVRKYYKEATGACLPKRPLRRQVVYEVGFSNLSYFSKVFKEQYGLLPSEYAVKVNQGT